MKAKKSLSANLEREQSMFMLLGFVTVLGLMFIVFEWSKPKLIIDAVIHIADNLGIDEEDQTPIVIDKVTPPPPAPTAALPPVIIETPEPVINSNMNLFTENPNPILSLPVIMPLPSVVEDPDEVFALTAVQKEPEFPGGKVAFANFLIDNLQYPASARDEKIQGTVYCTFIINKDGSYESLTLSKSADPELDEEAMRVLRLMPNWIPAEQNSKKVRVKMKVPIAFRLK